MPGHQRENVQPAEAVPRLGRQSGAIALVAEVAGQEDGLAAFRLDKPPHFLRVMLLSGHVGDGHVRPFARKGDGGGPAYPGVAPGHQRLAAHQTALARIGLLATVGFGVHVGLHAGIRLILKGIFAGMVLRQRILPLIVTFRIHNRFSPAC